MAAGCGGTVEDDGGAGSIGHGADEGLPGGVEGKGALRIGVGVEHQDYVEGTAAEVVGQRGGYGARAGDGFCGVTGAAGRPVDYHDAGMHNGEYTLPQPADILREECAHGAIGGIGINHIGAHETAAHALALKGVDDVMVGFGKSVSEPTAEAPRARGLRNGVPGVARDMDGLAHGAKIRAHQRLSVRKCHGSGRTYRTFRT